MAVKKEFIRQEQVDDPGEIPGIGSGSIHHLAEEIKEVHSGLSKASRHEKILGIREFLDNRLGKLDTGERRQTVERLRDYFGKPLPLPTISTPLREVAGMILGSEVLDAGNLDDMEIVERLKESFSTVFDALNQIVQALYGAGGPAGRLTADRTIRMLIGDRLRSEADTGNLSIQVYLDHIKRAFESVKEAFEEALNDKIKEMLYEISPERLAEDLGKRALMLGPLYKAALFDRFEKRFSHISMFVNQGHFTREVMLTFERKFGEKLSDSVQTAYSEGIGADEH
jgi:hypothetical protein